MSIIQLSEVCCRHAAAGVGEHGRHGLPQHCRQQPARHPALSVSHPFSSSALPLKQHFQLFLQPQLLFVTCSPSCVSPKPPPEHGHKASSHSAWSVVDPIRARGLSPGSETCFPKTWVLIGIAAAQVVGQRGAVVGVPAGAAPGRQPAQRHAAGVLGRRQLDAQHPQHHPRLQQPQRACASLLGARRSRPRPLPKPPIALRPAWCAAALLQQLCAHSSRLQHKHVSSLLVRWMNCVLYREDYDRQGKGVLCLSQMDKLSVIQRGI